MLLAGQNLRLPTIREKALIQPGFEPEFRSDALTNELWSSGIGAEDRWHLSTDTVRFQARSQDFLKGGYVDV